MPRITVKAFKKMIPFEYFDKNEEELENLKIGSDFSWTDMQISIEDILEHYDYKFTANRTVVVFADGRSRLLIKESFTSFSDRVREVEEAFIAATTPQMFTMDIQPEEDTSADEDTK